MTGPRRAARLGFARELLLAEIVRRCRECGAPARLGLTKQEARVYHGFECERCEAWNEDALAARDAPEWWDEVRAAAAERRGD